MDADVNSERPFRTILGGFKGYWQRIFNIRETGVFDKKRKNQEYIPNWYDDPDVRHIYESARARIELHQESAIRWRNVCRTRARTLTCLQVIGSLAFIFLLLYRDFGYADIAFGAAGLLAILVSMVDQMYQPSVRQANYNITLIELKDLSVFLETEYRKAQTDIERLTTLNDISRTTSEIGARMSQLPIPNKVSFWVQ